MKNPFRALFERKQERKQSAESLKAFADRAKAFTDDNPDVLVIMGDPETDVIFMACGGVVAPVRILDREGNSNRIVHNALKHTRGNADIDRFLLAVDGGLFAIAKGLYTKRRESLKGKVLAIVSEDNPPTQSAVTLTDGSSLSPIQVVDS